MLRGALLALALAAVPAAGRAHPHVFIDGGLDFLFDADGRLSDLRVTWIYDPLTSLFMMEDLGIDPAAALASAQRAALAAYQTGWDPEFEGDSYLRNGGRPIGLGRPRAAEAEVIDGKVAIRFLRAVETPFRPGAETVAEVYDPVFFTAYFVTEAPKLEGAAAGCRTRVAPYEPNGPLAALQQSLLDIGVDETPADPDVGALFADRVHVTCD